MIAIEYAYAQFCKERFPLPSEEQVAALEERMGAELPADYRRYVLEFNGGYFTEPDITPTVEGCPQDRLDFMNGVGASHPSAELASRRDLALFDDNDPPQILPIGYTLMGNLLLLVTHPDECGRIVLKKAFSDDSFFLANGVEEFFELLREPRS